jgi:hypothetical protein
MSAIRKAQPSSPTPLLEGEGSDSLINRYAIDENSNVKEKT